MGKEQYKREDLIYHYQSPSDGVNFFVTGVATPHGPLITLWDNHGQEVVIFNHMEAVDMVKKIFFYINNSYLIFEGEECPNV